MKYLILFLIPFLLQAYPTKPLTYGSFCSVFDKDFDEFRYSENIAHCKRKVSSRDRRFIYNRYKVNYNKRREYKVDHIIPLSLGGDNSYSNLWPQHKSIDTMKLEFKMYKQVRDNKLKRMDALKIILDAKKIR